MQGELFDSKKSVSYSDALHRKNASCRTISPAAVQLRKLVAAGEIPDTAYACIAVIHFGDCRGYGETGVIVLL